LDASAKTIAADRTRKAELSDQAGLRRTRGVSARLSSAREATSPLRTPTDGYSRGVWFITSQR